MMEVHGSLFHHPQALIGSLSNLVTTSVNQSLIPSSNNAVDIGSSTKNWRNAYVAGTLSAASVTALPVALMQLSPESAPPTMAFMEAVVI